MRKNPTDTELGNYVPPHSIEMEQCVIGSMLIEAAAIEKAADILNIEDFYRETHQVLFDVIVTLSKRPNPVDLAIVMEELKTRDKLEAVGGVTYLTSLFDTVPTAANVEYYARSVQEKSLVRKVIVTCLEGIGAARGYDPDEGGPGAIIDSLQTKLVDLRQGRGQSKLVHVREPLNVAWDDAERRSMLTDSTRLTGLSTGIPALDTKTGGLQNSDLIIIAARPSAGKTALALSIAEHVARVERKGVAIFSLEMSAVQLAVRLLCSLAGVDSRDFRAGKMAQDGWDRSADAVEQLYEMGLYIRDAIPITPDDMSAECRTMQTKNNLGLIVVDYLQLCRANRKTENRTQEIGEIARGLKALARKFNVPVIALSQLSRAVENRENKRPVLSDLRESGDIEAEADIVSLLYREAYYKQKALEEAGSDESNSKDGEQQIVEANLAKHRNGPTGPIKIGFIPRYARFGPYEEQDPNLPTGF